MKNMYKNNSFERNSSSKAMKFIFIFILVIGTNQFCKKKYLDLRPLGEVDETSLANKEGVERLLIGAYSLLDGIGGNKSSFFFGGFKLGIWKHRRRRSVYRW